MNSQSEMFLAGYVMLKKEMSNMTWVKDGWMDLMLHFLEWKKLPLENGTQMSTIVYECHKFKS